jgi:hypothetical protein
MMEASVLAVHAVTTWPLVLFAGILALWFSKKALSASTKSRKLAYVSVVLGILALFYLEKSVGLRPTDDPLVFRISGTLRALLGLAGISLAVAALIIRRRDRGTGLIVPIVGGALSLTHLAMGLAFFYFASLASLGSPLATGSTAWTYRSSEYGFTITLPSDYWKGGESNDPSHFGFEDSMHSMHVGIKVVKEDRKGFDAAVKHLHKIVDDSPDSTTNSQSEGFTASGHPYAYITVLEKGDKGHSIFVGISYVWCEEKGIMVQVIFEGMQRMESEIGKESEGKLFEESARSLCLSVGK